MKKPTDKAELGRLLFRRNNADKTSKAELDSQISRLVLRGTRISADGDSVKKVAELATGLRDLAKAGRYGDMSPNEAVKQAAQLRGVDASDVPDSVKTRLAKLT